MTYDPGLNVPPGNDTPGIDSGTTIDGGTGYDQPGVSPTVDTPDPYGTADQAQYDDGTVDGPDVGIAYQPPWSTTRAPGTRRPIIAGEIVPIDPWQPTVALLNADQLALLNRETAIRQAAAYWIDNPRDV